MAPWRDLTDPRRVDAIGDLEAGLKEPVYENLDIPEAFGPVTICIDDHKIKRFCFTQDDYSAWYLEDGKGPFSGRRVGQPCLLGNDLLQLFTTRYRASRTVGFHTEEQMWFDSPAEIGETVTLSGAYVNAYERRGQGYVVMEAQAIGEDGRSVLRHRGIEIFRTVPGRIGGRASDTPGQRVTGEVRPDARVVQSFDWTVAESDVLAPVCKTITSEQAAVFSRIGEYVHNIHNDLRIARAGELPTLIVQGQQQAALLGNYLAHAFGRNWFSDGWFRLKFLEPLQVFEPVELSAVVTKVEPLPDGRRRVDLEVWVRRASDRRLTTVGWASCVMTANTG